MPFKGNTDMSEEIIRTQARKFALQNAVQFEGKANPKAVIGKCIAILKSEGYAPKEIIPIVNQVISEVNSLPLQAQLQELKQIAPELLQKEKKERDFTLPDLPHAEKGKVITRFPPEPNGYLHIGHAKAAIIDSTYATMYEGSFVLRFDDTNPENALDQFYEAQKEDLRWLDLSWDEEYCTSDHLQQHYQLAEQLISQSDAYICNCAGETIKEGRYNKHPCDCTKRSAGEHLDAWKQLLQEDRSGILRLKADMQSDNTAMRDPTLFRVIEKEHPRQGTKYRVWPTYDFAGAVEDSIGGITHPFRTKEYELRDEVYFYLLDRLNLRRPHLMEFARLNIEGMPVSKRKIKPLIDQGLAEGFHDFRLPTLRGLRRRGIVAEGIRQFVFSQGISKVESTVDFSIVESFNRKVIDPLVKRYFFVPNPIKLIVEDASPQKALLKNHPTQDMGTRTLPTASTFYIRSDDVIELREGDLFRLKELYNVTITEKNDTTIKANYAGTELVDRSLKLQWTTEDYLPLTLIIPGTILDASGAYNPDSLSRIHGFAEPAVADLADGEIVQFERVGFARIERQHEELCAIFTHK